MSESRLRGLLRGERETLNWICFERYAQKVFAGDPADWFSDPTRFAGTMAQAQELIQTEIFSLNLFNPLLPLLSLSAEHSSGEKNSAVTLQSLIVLLESEEAFAFTDSVIRALAHQFGDAVDFFLEIPCATDLLHALGAAADATPDFDQLDDFYTQLLDRLRPWAERPIHGVLLAYSSTNVLSDDDREAIEPVTLAARHYGWTIAASLAGDETLSVPELDCDLALFPRIVAPMSRQGNVTLCGGIAPDFWSGADLAPTSGLRFGSIPELAEPERVVEQLKRLRS